MDILNTFFSLSACCFLNGLSYAVFREYYFSIGCRLEARLYQSNVENNVSVAAPGGHTKSRFSPGCRGKER